MLILSMKGFDYLRGRQCSRLPVLQPHFNLEHTFRRRYWTVGLEPRNGQPRWLQAQDTGILITLTAAATSGTTESNTISASQGTHTNIMLEILLAGKTQTCRQWSFGKFHVDIIRIYAGPSDLRKNKSTVLLTDVHDLDICSITGSSGN